MVGDCQSKHRWQDESQRTVNPFDVLLTPALVVTVNVSMMAQLWLREPPQETVVEFAGSPVRITAISPGATDVAPFNAGLRVALFG